MLAPPVAAIRTAVRQALTALPPPTSASADPAATARSAPSSDPAHTPHSAPAALPPSDPVGTARTAPAAPADSVAPLVLVACSGGADSLALAAATAFVAPRLGWRVGLLTVDHGLQPGSSDRAKNVAGWAQQTGLDPVEILPVSVAGRPGGPEAAARSARYEALATAAGRLGASAVLLGHTRDDQAETVLLALARGAGPRGLAGMPPRSWTPPSSAPPSAATPPSRTPPAAHPPARSAPPSRGSWSIVARNRVTIDQDLDGRPATTASPVAWLRPLLDIPRSQTRAACAALALEPWDDPHNTDPSYARARVRATALPALVEALGPRVVGNLAQTARQLAADTAALDALAAEALATARTPDGSLSVGALQQLPPAIRTRTLHAWVLDLGVPGTALSHRHIDALDALITNWHGQGPIHLPSGLTFCRLAGKLQCDRTGGHSLSYRVP